MITWRLVVLFADKVPPALFQERSSPHYGISDFAHCPALHVSWHQKFPEMSSHPEVIILSINTASIAPKNPSDCDISYCIL